ncbi:hypothetical protein Nepgr_020306 [Nepenthes gracilis]|uniref:Protein SMG9 n=1 Tax=Nepenthes gracilis TaxID=150966 RepID=A0AAD3XW56_NEPGR|nr:hypothetical protein Nepgr_020306 [Nepenthes gracilis]
MAAFGGTSSSSSSSTSTPAPAPKILLAKPGFVVGGHATGKFIRGGSGGEDDNASVRSRLPPVGSLNLLSDSWEFHIDRFLPFLTDNTEFTVVGVIGPPGAGKSTIMNEIYGFDPTSPGMLPPFAIQSEETRANARHCTIGIEPRVSAERLILLDTQPVFSPSILTEMTRPDGSSAIPVLSGENLSAELAHELMSIQLGVLLASICHIILVVSEGVHESNMWHLLSTVDLLKHGISDPSSVTTAHSQNPNLGPDKENKIQFQEIGVEYIAAPVFIHTKLRDGDFTAQNFQRMRKALARYFTSSLFFRADFKSMSTEHFSSTGSNNGQSHSLDSKLPNLFLIPFESKNASSKAHYESYELALWKLRDQVLSMACPTFSRTLSERDWLKNSAKIWELVKNSSIIAEYNRMLHDSGLFRR